MQSSVLILARSHWWLKGEVLHGLKYQGMVTCGGWEEQTLGTLKVLDLWDLLWDFFYLTWVVIILPVLHKNPNFAVIIIGLWWYSTASPSRWWLLAEKVSDIQYCRSSPTQRAQPFLWKPHVHAGSCTTTILVSLHLRFQLTFLFCGIP